MHIGIVSPPISGHLNPLTTLGRELARRGHRVRLIGLPDARRKAETAALEYLPYGTEDFPVGWVGQVTDTLGELSGPDALAFTIDIYRRMAEAQFRDLPGILRAEGIEGLVIDQTERAPNVAQALGVPYVTACAALPLNAEPFVPPFSSSWPYEPTPEGVARNKQGYRQTSQLGNPLRDIANAYRAQVGLSPLGSMFDADSSLATVAQLPEALDFPRQMLPPTFHYTGPWHTAGSGDPAPFPWEELTGKPVIYASLGTLQNRLLPLFQTIAAACAGLDAQLVLSCGRYDRAAHAGFPGNPIVVPFAPQLELLRRAALVISHAGLNTVLESLAHGVPLVVLPIANDQPGVAARVRHAGVGELLEPAGLTVDGLRDTVTRLLNDPTYRRKARDVQEVLAGTDGLSRAAAIIETALTTRQPVFRSR